MAYRGLYFNCLCAVFLYSGVILAAHCLYYKPRIKSRYETVLEKYENHTVFCEGNAPLTWTWPNVSGPYKEWTTFTVEEVVPEDMNYKYASTLFIENISYPFVGFYYCHEIDSNITDERKSTKIYLFVNDYEHLAVSDEDPITVTVTQHHVALLPCRPTAPDVHVEMLPFDTKYTYDPKTGFEFEVNDLSQQVFYECIFSRNSTETSILVFIHVLPEVDSLPTPYIDEVSGGHTTVGGQLILECLLRTQAGIKSLVFEWNAPAGNFGDRISVDAMSHVNDIYSQKLFINRTTLADNGRYTCKVLDMQKHESSVYHDVKIYDIGEHFINLTEENGVYEIPTEAGRESVQWKIDVKGHPEPKLSWLNNRNESISMMDTSKYEISFKNGKEAFLKIKDIQITDFGIYTLVAENEYEIKTRELFLNVTDKPTVLIKAEDFYLINSVCKINCIVAAYPEPNIFWEYKPCASEGCIYEPLYNNINMKQKGLQIISQAKINCTNSGFIRCVANNSIGSDESISGVYVSDVKNGFDVFDFGTNINLSNDKRNATTAVGDPVSLTCGVSIHNYSGRIEWLFEDRVLKTDDRYNLETHRTEYSNRLTLYIPKVNKSDSGVYSCKAIKNGEIVFSNITFTVCEPIKPYFKNTNMKGILDMNLPNRVSLFCEVAGIPKPQITWYKDEMAFKTSNSRVKLDESGERLIFTSTDVSDEGTYKCEAYNKKGVDFREMTLNFKNKPANLKLIIIIFASIVGLLILSCSTIMCYICKKRKRELKELRMAGLINFEKGAIENLNPDLGVDDQAELLPYDKKWEFPIENLKLGKQLGSGAFGVVMKGLAKNIVDDEESTTVAVKMVKKNADYTYIKALASELKIMVHLGKHLNVVNLLGACTKNVAKRELFVIVEYCRFGNLHNYLLRHRHNFINQVDPNYGKIDYQIGQDVLERAYSVSSNMSNAQSPLLKYAALTFSNSSGPQVNNEMADYRGNANYSGVTSRTEMTSVSTPNSGQDEDGVVLSNNSVQPEWRSNYKGDYKGNVKPICTKDLLAWAFQVARGMDYLASRKVLHGDLAARNILLADNNIVKICDFGLAKSMYKNDNYKKKGDGPLPIKWMAIESIRDRVFSTQSDVWSFGIVLWEFFSLARTPYPGMEADERLYNKLVDGYRMEAPEFAPNEMYKMMTDCWNPKPLGRPSFDKLAERIGTVLEDSIRRHYIDLNDPYLVMNTQRLEEGENDYLSMLSPPNFENLSSPNHYINEINETQEDGMELGYLRMTPAVIFSPRVDDERVFDFNINNRKDSNGSEMQRNEMVPMLHSINESDVESPLCQSPTSPNSYSNPSYHIPPNVRERTNLNEETNTNGDRDIVKSSDNYVNMPQNKINKDKITTTNDINSKLDDKERHYVNNTSRVWESINV